jgi:hypothetical protein
MTTLSYSLPASRDELWARGTYGEVRFEVPAIFNADGSCDADDTAEKIGIEVVDQYLARRNIEMVTTQIARGSAIRDRLYVAGEIARDDYTIASPQAADILAELEQEFPDAADYRSNPANLIGRYDAYRPPYANPSISWYEMKAPSAALLGQYGAAGYRTYMDWYGLKFDLVSREIMLKVVLGADCFIDQPLPPLPRGAKFYARIHRSDGSVAPEVDCYVLSDRDVMQAYCQAVGYPWPYADDAAASVWLYGVTFNIETQQIDVVKAYERTQASA